MKTRRIWIVIVVILVAGVCSTTYTKRYVEELEISTAMRSMTETAYDTAMPESDPGMPDTRGATEAALPFAADAAPTGIQKPAAQSGADPRGAAGQPAASSLTDGEVLAEDGAAPAMTAGTPTSGAADPAELSYGAAARMVPETAVAQNAPPPNTADAPPHGPGAAAGAAGQDTPSENHSEVIVAGGGKEKLEVSYKNRLEELDAQIERNRKADAEKPVANSVKARAENELRLWEAELDGILKALEERLDSTQTEELYTEQREWRREKESKALEASKRQSGSTLEEVEYSLSLAESTRLRAYELVKEYEAVLQE